MFFARAPKSAALGAMGFGSVSAAGDGEGTPESVDAVAAAHFAESRFTCGEHDQLRPAQIEACRFQRCEPPVFTAAVLALIGASECETRPDERIATGVSRARGC